MFKTCLSSSIISSTAIGLSISSRRGYLNRSSSQSNNLDSLLSDIIVSLSFFRALVPITYPSSWSLIPLHPPSSARAWLWSLPYLETYLSKCSPQRQRKSFGHQLKALLHQQIQTRISAQGNAYPGLLIFMVKPPPLFQRFWANGFGLDRHRTSARFREFCEISDMVCRNLLRTGEKSCKTF